MTNLQAWSKAAGTDELDMLITLIRHHWQLGEAIRRGELPPIPDWSIQSAIQNVVEWAWQPNEDLDLEFEVIAPRGSA